MAFDLQLPCALKDKGGAHRRRRKLGLKPKQKHKPDYTLDFRKAITSIALLELSRIFEAMEPNQILEIYVHDKDTISDICKVLPKSSYEMNINEGENSVSRIKITKVKLN